MEKTKKVQVFKTDTLKASKIGCTWCKRGLI